jgi:hypothetical protein
VYFTSGGFGFRLWYSATEGRILLEGFNSSGTRIVYLTGPALTPANTFFNFLVSFDLTNTANRWFYLNDVLQSSGWTNYSNQDVSFGSGTTQIGTGLDDFIGRLSNIYLDQTYRDLSVEANRRLFVTADLKPALGQAALNPILYLPMSDPTQPGLNQGTGGNFTLTGVVARSGRGPNQYNAPYSDLDGSADYLERSSTLGSPNFPNVITFDCTFNSDSISTTQHIFSNGSSRNIWIYLDSSKINIAFHNGSSEFARFTQTNSLVSNRNYTLTFSVDFRSSSTRTVYLNGEPLSGTWSSYSNSTVPFTNTPYRVGVRSDALIGYFNGRIGRVYLGASSNTGYIDLSVPANLAKFVTGTGINATPVDLGATGQLPTGTSPQLYLPMYGNNAGKNYGTGGDFSVNSGPYTGARGPNEFWGNRADFTASPYLSRTTALTGITNTKQITLSFWATFDNWGQVILSLADSAGNFNVYVDNASNKIRVFACNASGAIILQAETPATLSTGTSYHIQMCADMTSTTLRAFYINGVSVAATWSYTNDTIAYQQASLPTIGAYWNGSQYTAASRLDGRISELYLSNGFVDFRFEANRLLFRDAFGNPTDLPSAITAATVPNPAIYMRFPPTAFGTNSGTGGNFTVNGTITDGGQL